MLKIAFVESTYRAPEDDEDDYCPEPDSVTDHAELSFRDVVLLMRHQYREPSCSHPTGTVHEWLNAEPEQDFRTGDHINRSMHYAHDNPPHNARYWRLAMRAAGLIKGA